MNDLKFDQDLAALSLDELIDLGIRILEEVKLRVMEAAGEIESERRGQC